MRLRVEGEFCVAEEQIRTTQKGADGIERLVVLEEGEKIPRAYAEELGLLTEAKKSSAKKSKKSSAKKSKKSSAKKSGDGTSAADTGALAAPSAAKAPRQRG